MTLSNFTLNTRTSVRVRYRPVPSEPLFSPSKCKGFTRISEDSSEIAFLLVENYTKTARIGPWIGAEFLDNDC